MVVLHIIKGLGLAGAENHLITLLAGLRRRGIDARLLLWVSPSQQADDVVAAAQKHSIPIERWTMPGHFAPRFFFKLLRYLRRERPDIVHTHLVHAETYGIPAARLAGIRHVINSSHNDDPFRRNGLFRIRSWLLWRLTQRGIAISGAIKTFLIEVEHARPDQIEVIYYGLDSSQSNPLPQSTLRQELGLPESTKIIGSMCRLVPQKGITYAIEAMKLLREICPDLHYVIAGDGILRRELEAQATDNQQIHFLGWRNDVRELMRQFDLFLAPSLWEGFGLVFLEAMGQRVPIIASNISSIPEIVQGGVTGLLVEARNPQAIAEAIRQLVNDPAAAQQMGEAGRQRLETDFTEQRMIDQTAALYEQVIQ